MNIISTLPAGTPTGGQFKALPTSVEGWSFCETLPQLAQRAEHLTLLRTLRTPEQSHARAIHVASTGYRPSTTVDHPSLGALASRYSPDANPDLPGFVQVFGRTVSSAGFLGANHHPLHIVDLEQGPGQGASSEEIGERRQERRRELLKSIEQSFEGRGGRETVQAYQSMRGRARRLLTSPALRAFDLDQESLAVRKRYGENNFGQACLLARRLVEVGVAAVEVVLEGWDTHRDHHVRTRANCDMLDPGFSALIDDLREREMEDQVLIVCMGEFGRTPEVVDGDGRDHWSRNWCVALSGGGTRGGVVVGETDELGKEIVDRPLSIADLFQTLSHLIGFDPDETIYQRERPVILVDPEGSLIPEVLA